MTSTTPKEPDYYQLLHVQQDAPLPVIRASYRALMQKLKQHPDLGGSHANAAALNQAYAVLSSQTQRLLYDARQAQQQNIGLEPKSTPTHTTGALRHPAPSTQQSTATTGGSNSQLTTPVWHCLFCSSRNRQTEFCATCQSPLQRLLQVTGGRTDQRSLQRLPQAGTLALQAHWQADYLTGQCQDLTPRGMRLQANRQLQVNSIVRVKSDICHAVARVAHASATRSHWSYGIEFLTLSIEQPLGRFVATQA